MSGLIPRGHAERGNWFRQLAHVVHLGRCTRFPFGDCHRHEESEYFTPKDNDIASVVIKWLEFDQGVTRTIRTVEQLDALPEQSVIRNDMFGVVFEREIENDGTAIWASIHGEPRTSVSLPATLLWHPDWETK